ncbi:MAG: extracellular solute-binding protein [Bacilli bacterium]|nr:extracellular solute-binding protein [Bacilli bacterium]
MVFGKTFKKLLVFAAAGFLLTGCDLGGNGDGSGSDDTPTTEGLIKEATEITFSTTAGKNNQDALNSMIDSFKKIEPNVTVKLDIVSGSYSDIASTVKDGFNSGVYADLAMVYPDAVADYIDAARAIKLDNYINNKDYGLSEEDLKDILPSFLEEGRQYTSTGTFSMPFSKSTEIVYYDRSKILGLELDGVNNGDPINQRYLDNLTWDEFFDNFCPKLVAFTETEAGKNYIDKTGDNGWAVLSYDSDANLFITLAEQYGYDYTKVENGVGKLLFSNDGMKALCKKFNGYAKNHYINSQASTNVRSNTYMQAGQSLFAVGSTAGTQYYSPANNTIDIGVFRLPQKDNSNAKVLLQGPSMTFLRHLKADGTTDQNRALASWLFYRHCITKQNALLWSTTANYMPIRESAYATKDYEDVYNEKNCTPKTQDMLDARVANKVADFQQMYFTSPAFKGSNAARDAVDGLMGKVLGKTCNGTDDEINAIFKEAYDAASKQL